MAVKMDTEYTKKTENDSTWPAHAHAKSKTFSGAREEIRSDAAPDVTNINDLGEWPRVGWRVLNGIFSSNRLYQTTVGYIGIHSLGL